MSEKIVIARDGKLKEITISKTVYLCVNDNNYCHEVFDNLLAASFWCSKHEGFHVIERELRHNQPK